MLSSQSSVASKPVDLPPISQSTGDDPEKIKRDDSVQDTKVEIYVSARHLTIFRLKLMS